MWQTEPPTSAKDRCGLSLGLPVVITALRGSDLHLFLQMLFSSFHPIFIQGISAANEMPSFTYKLMQFHRFVLAFLGAMEGTTSKERIYGRKSVRWHQPLEQLHPEDELTILAFVRCLAAIPEADTS